MKNFMMLFRNVADGQQPSPEQLQAMVKKWDNWKAELEKTGNFVASEALGYQGKTINATGTITNGPYAEVKEHIGGYTIVKANDLDHAAKLAEGCPILQVGGTVEVRDIMVFNF